MIKLVPEAVLVDGEAVPGYAVCVANGVIETVGPARDLPAGRDVEVVDLPGQLVMPGLVNAHQHGRGLTSLQLGAADDVLEQWLATKRLRAPIDPYAMTLLAAMQMIASGVTSAIQANSAYGTGNYETEIFAEMKAYETAGLRVMIGIGAMDRADVVYPAEAQDAFIRSLPAPVRKLVGGPSFQLYMGDGKATADFLAKCQRLAENHPTVTFGYSPAGPQWASDGLLRDIADDAASRKVPVHMHALESLAQAIALREVYPKGLLRHLMTLGLASERLSLAHAVWLTEDDVDIAVDTGVVVVRNPGSNLRLRAGIAPLAYYLSRGLRVGIGTDNTTLAEDEDLFKELRLAARLARSPYWDGPPPPTAKQLLSMATGYGAAAMLQSDRIGRIKAGFKADLIAISLQNVRGAYLDEDIPLLDAVLARASQSDVRLTMINGEILYRDGAFARLSPEKVYAAAAETARQTRRAPGVDPAVIKELATHLAKFYRARSTHLVEKPWAPVTENRGWS